MYQFFVEDEQIANDLVIIEGSDVNHIRNVLRMKCGEKVRISSTSGRNFFGTIDRIAENVVEVCIMEETALDTELPCRICLFQGDDPGGDEELRRKTGCKKSGGKDGALAGDCKECGKTVKAQQNSGGERTGELPGGSRIGGRTRRGAAAV